MLIAILVGILLAALVYWICLVLGLPSIIAIVAAILVLILAIGGGPRMYGRRGRSDL